MKLFLKHIGRSIKRSPLQPFLICLVATLAVALCVTVTRLSITFVDHAMDEAHADEQLGDIMITPRTDAASHLLFCEDVQGAVGADASVLGEFRLSGYTELSASTHVLSISALDLPLADAFYEFSFVEYDTFTTQNLNSSAILTTTAARNMGLSLGDSFTVRIWESTHTFVVRAIAQPTGLLSGTDMLIPISGLLQTLAEKLPILSSLGEDFAPCTRLLLRVADGVDRDALVERLSAEEALEGCTVSLTNKDGRLDYMVATQLAFLLVLLSLLLVLAAFVICTALSLLQECRATEYAIFASAGASRRQIAVLTYLESGCYALLCSVLGVLLSYPILRFTGGFYPWLEHTLTPRPLGVAVAFVSAFGLMTCCTAVYLHRGRRDVSRHEVSRTVRILSLVVLLLALLACYTVPYSMRVLPCALTLLVVLWVMYCWCSHLLCRLALFLERGAKKAAPWLLLAFKSIARQRMLRHVARMLAVMLALILGILVCADQVTGQLEDMSEELPFDFAVMEVTAERGGAILQDGDVAAGMYLLYDSNVQLPDGTMAFALSLSGDLEECAPNGYREAHVPKGNEVVLSVGLLERLGCKEGDVIPLKIGGVTRDFVVTAQLYTNLNCLYFDASYLGLEPSVLCVRMREGAWESAEVQQRITTLAESNGGVILPSRYVFGVLPDTLGGHLRLTRCLSMVALVLGVLGCINALVQQRDARRRERKILSECGMCRADVRRMGVTEFFCVFAFAALCALPACALLCTLVDLGVRTFGIVLFL